MSPTMLAGRLRLDSRTFAVEEVPVPQPAPGEVLVEVKAAGVCLSDVHLIDGGLSPFRPDDAVSGSGALTLGHEVAGVVHALGAGVRGGWAPGDRVVLQGGRGCERCPACLRGFPCPEFLTLGVDYDGGWAQYVIAREDTLVRIPDGLPFEQAAIIPDAVSTPYAAIVTTGAVRPGQSAGIWGIGGLGAHGVRIARYAGASPVIAVDPLPTARARALAFGADLALDPAAPDFADEIARATGGQGLDLAFDFAGFPEVRDQALACLGIGGALVLAGLTPAPLTVPDTIRFSLLGQQIRGHYGSAGHDLDRLVALTAAGRIDLAPSISDRIPLADAAEAVARLEKKAGDPVRLLLIP